MKRISIFVVLFLMPSIFSFGWGDKGHKLITEHALVILMQKIQFPDNIREEIIRRSVDPDNRKKEDPSEPVKHFIDIDFYPEFLDGKMITSLDSLVKIYGDSVVTKMGTLPWATEITYQNLVSSFKANDKEKIVLYMSDIAHYIGDGHQALHATLNYNGQLTSQKGLHFRYEIEMLDKNLDEVKEKLKLPQIGEVNDLESYIFDYISESNYYVDLILDADKKSLVKDSGKYEEKYYNMLWQRTKYVTINSINNAAYSIASIIYSAWIDAGKPELNL